MEEFNCSHGIRFCMFGRYCAKEKCNFCHDVHCMKNETVVKIREVVSRKMGINIDSLKGELIKYSSATLLHFAEILYPLDVQKINNFSNIELLETILTRKDVLEDLCLSADDIKAGIYFFKKCHKKDVAKEPLLRYLCFLEAISFPQYSGLEFNHGKLIRDYFQII